MEDLVAFLAARLDEDAATADALFFACRIPDRIPDFTAAGGPAAEQFWGHFTAARALREVEAGRAILTEYGTALQVPADRETEDEVSWRLALEKVITIRAAVYSDHPGYRPEWAPVT